MTWFANLKIRSKMILSFSIFLLILCFVIFQSIKTMNVLSKANEDLYHNQFKLADTVTRIDDDNNNIQMSLLTLVLVNEKTEKDQWMQQVKNLEKERGQKITEAEEIVKNNPKFKASLESVKKSVAESKKIMDEKLFPAINDGNSDLAKKIVLQEHLQNLEDMSNVVDSMVIEAHAIADAGVLAAKQEVAKNINVFLMIGFVTFIVAIIIILIMDKLISLPLNELSLISKKIANGELKIPKLSSTHRKDEVGILASSFKMMVTNLHKLTQEVSEVINFLTSSSSEISSASSQLSSSASETATSISETTSTIEEVKQTSQVASKKANLVSETAKKTKDMSESGKKAADDINISIEQIGSQMDLIAETMMRLNEQSHAVGAIISSVEDLAQQTNLLAVNASIEASKAGEQGKGFSVVAQEVKSLANQSKQATNQVRSILSDIQKATSAAVMATELGSKSVENGVKKTSEAGNAIISLIQIVKDNSQAATQIAAVSQQQLVGMEQATVAMENIKQASNQNVESAKLLKDSVVNIKELSERLKRIIDQFIVE